MLYCVASRGPTLECVCVSMCSRTCVCLCMWWTQGSVATCKIDDTKDWCIDHESSRTLVLQGSTLGPSAIWLQKKGLQRSRILEKQATRQCVAVCCSVLHCVAVCCSVPLGHLPVDHHNWCTRWCVLEIAMSSESWSWATHIDSPGCVHENHTLAMLQWATVSRVCTTTHTAER